MSERCKECDCILSSSWDESEDTCCWCEERTKEEYDQFNTPVGMGDSPPKTEQGSASMSIDLTDGIITVRHGTTDAILHRGVAPIGTWGAIWELIRRNVKEESA